MRKLFCPLLMSVVLVLVAMVSSPVHGDAVVRAQAPTLGDPGACPPDVPPRLCPLLPTRPLPRGTAPPVGTAAVPAGLRLIDLGTFGGGSSFSSDINDAGQLVGWSETAKGEPHAFVWTEAGELRDLGDLGGFGSYAIAINKVGQIVGNSKTAKGALHAFLWTAASGMRDLGTLGGDYIYSDAGSINEVGQVIGNSSTAKWQQHAFIWTAATGMRDLGTLGGTDSEAVDINDAGQVVGRSVTADGEWHAFLWTAASGMRDLGTLSGYGSGVIDINNAGEVVGQTDTTNYDEPHAVLWTSGGGMRDLGTLGGPNSYATAINDAGQVVGYSPTPSSSAHAFVWTAATGMRDLGTLGGYRSEADAINEAGQVVGRSATVSGEEHAFVWTAATGMRDLGKLGGIESTAIGINDAGQIIGTSRTANGNIHAVLWSPQPGPLVVDTFSRSVANGWGDAELGSTYSVSGLATYYAVDGQSGTMTLPPGISGAAFLPAVSTHDLDARVRVATDKRATGGPLTADLALRSASEGSAYRARLGFTPTGAVQLQAARAVNNVETALGTPVTVPKVTHTANSFVWLRVQATGANPTTLRLKAWADGQTEPAAWQLTLTDSTATLQGAGSVGLRASVPATTTNGPIQFRFDSFYVRVGPGVVFVPLISAGAAQGH